MRRFFRFSIRDLFWLTLVVAVALGWFARERHLVEEGRKADQWRLAVGGLERLLYVEGYKLAWDFESSTVEIVRGRQDIWPADGYKDIFVYRSTLSTRLTEPRSQSGK